MKQIKITSSGIAFITAIILFGCIAGCYAIAKMKLPDMTPGLQAISYDLKNLGENRRAFTSSNGTFIRIDRPPTHPGNPAGLPDQLQTPIPGDLPESWDVRDSHYADVTGDGEPELLLLVWRPWRDLPLTGYSDSQSPISEFHDETGDSCHIALIDPDTADKETETSRSYREIWVGSALPIPILRIEVADVDDDGLNELVALEGSYKDGRDGPGNRVSVWGWNGFGFSVDWRSEQSHFNEIALEDINGDNIADIIAW